MGGAEFAVGPQHANPLTPIGGAAVPGRPVRFGRRACSAHCPPWASGEMPTAVPQAHSVQSPPRPAPRVPPPAVCSGRCRAGGAAVPLAVRPHAADAALAAVAAARILPFGRRRAPWWRGGRGGGVGHGGAGGGGCAGGRAGARRGRGLALWDRSTQECMLRDVPQAHGLHAASLGLSAIHAAGALLCCCENLCQLRSADCNSPRLLCDWGGGRHTTLTAAGRSLAGLRVKCLKAQHPRGCCCPRPAVHQEARAVPRSAAATHYAASRSRGYRWVLPYGGSMTDAVGPTPTSLVSFNPTSVQ